MVISCAGLSNLKGLKSNSVTIGADSMNYQDYIEITPGKRSGKPCIKQTRITVYDVLAWLASGQSISDVLVDFPELNQSQVQACLAYAAEREHHLLSVTAA